MWQYLMELGVRKLAFRLSDQSQLGVRELAFLISGQSPVAHKHPSPFVYLIFFLNRLHFFIILKTETS